MVSARVSPPRLSAARGEIDLDVAEVDGFLRSVSGAPGGVLRLAAQHGVDAGEQFARVERLGQVVVGAHFEADDAVDLVALGGQHDDRRHVAGAAQAAADRQAVLAGQHQVEHDQVEMLAGPRPVHLRGIGDALDGEALFAEVAVQQVAQAAVVVDDEDAVLSLVHGMKGRPATAGGMVRMVTSFCRSDRRNKLLQSGCRQRAVAPPGRCTMAAMMEEEVSIMRVARPLVALLVAATLLAAGSVAQRRVPPRGRGRAAGGGTIAAGPAPADAAGNARALAADAA